MCACVRACALYALCAFVLGAQVLSLTTRDQDNGGKRETTNVEFTHEQLAAFSRQLDRIQEQMDALG